jgi:hypothetical protein
MTTPNKGGRPPAEPHLQRINVPLRLPRWLVDWMDAHRVYNRKLFQAGKPGTRAEVIEAALIKAYRLKAPAIRKTP